MRTLLSFLLLIIFTALLACSPSESDTEPTATNTNSRAAPNNATEPEPKPPRMIKPGETTVAFGPMTFTGRALGGDSDGGCDEPCIFTYDMCRLLGPFPDSLAIVELIGIEGVETDVCSEKRLGWYGIYQLKTLAVVVGKELPEDLPTILYSWGVFPPRIGDILLLSLYSIGDEWVLSGNAATVQLGSDAIQPVPSESQGVPIQWDLPPDFEGLIAEAEQTLRNYEECRQGPWKFWTSPEKVDAWLTTPGDPRCGFPEFPPDAPDSSSTEEWYRQFGL